MYKLAKGKWINGKGLPLSAANTDSCRCHVLKAAERRHKNIKRNNGNPITAMNPQIQKG